MVAAPGGRGKSAKRHVDHFPNNEFTNDFTNDYSNNGCWIKGSMEPPSARNSRFDT